MDHRSHPFLPEELVIEILLRLPVESLTRLKTVCKYWYNIITSPNFIDNHFDHPTNNSRLLVYHNLPYSRKSTIFSIFPDETLSGEPPSHHHLVYLHMLEHLDGVIGPVNGVFCLCRFGYKSRYGYDAALVNPATRECKPLLVPDYSDSEPFHSWYFHMFGFGLDPLTKDFKVVSICCWDETMYSFPSTRHPRVAVYSLANDSWTYHDLDPVITWPRCKLSGSSAIYINGSCYWMLSCDNKYFLLAFDLTSEVVREINGPKYNTLHLVRAKLLLYNDSLAMLFRREWDGPLHFAPFTDVMVMKEEGCWTKDVTIDLSFSRMTHTPLGFWTKNKVILRRGDKQLVLYDLNTHDFKELGIDKLFLGSQVLPFIYKESLVSLRGQTMHHVIQDYFNFGTLSVSSQSTRKINDQRFKEDEDQES